MADVLPSLYQGWVTELLQAPVPSEPRVTCASCAMLDHPGQPRLETAFFPETKCCTFTPDLPNFLVGRILADTDAGTARAREILRQRLAAGVAVTPFGVHIMPVHKSLYDAMAAGGRSAFGRAPLLRCPYYIEDGGLCGIWRHRDGTCSTWFCKNERGMLGVTFWRVLAVFLRLVEKNLKLWCAGKAGLAEEPLAELWSTAEQRPPTVGLDDAGINNAVNMQEYQRVWGDAGDDPEAFFIRCAEAVAPLKAADVLAIGGVILSEAARALKLVHEKVFTIRPLPERVQRGPQALVQIGRRPGEARARHPALPYDWVDLPPGLAAELGRFEGGTLASVVAELQGMGIAIDEALVRRLLDWQVLARA